MNTPVQCHGYVLFFVLTTFARPLTGPVTAGVLRGERSRFQLFGDTVVRISVCVSFYLVYELFSFIQLTRPSTLEHSTSTVFQKNTTARMESTGKPNMVQLSQETTELLRAGGKGHWVQLREDKVQAKGKKNALR